MIHYDIYIEGTCEKQVEVTDLLKAKAFVQDLLGMKGVEFVINTHTKLGPVVEKPAELNVGMALTDEPVIPDDRKDTNDETPVPVQKEPVKEEPKVEITKAVLKAKLFELRDKLGSEAVEACYNEAGNGAESLNKLDPSLYEAVYNKVEEKLHAAD